MLHPSSIIPSGRRTDSPAASVLDPPVKNELQEESSGDTLANVLAAGDVVNYVDHEYFDSFPPGYRFCPLDEELILHYLKKKVLREELPMNKIMEVNLYKYDPDTLAAMYRKCGETEWYFFTPRDRKYPNGDRPNRAAGDGYWKATGADKKIRWHGEEIGARKALVYYMGKPPKGVKTNWIMHEYKVVASSVPPRAPRTNKTDMRLDDFVLCRIYKKAEKYSFTRPARYRDDPTPLAAAIVDPPPPAVTTVDGANHHHHHHQTHHHSHHHVMMSSIDDDNNFDMATTDHLNNGHDIVHHSSSPPPPLASRFVHGHHQVFGPEGPGLGNFNFGHIGHFELQYHLQPPPPPTMLNNNVDVIDDHYYGSSSGYHGGGIDHQQQQQHHGYGVEEHHGVENYNWNEFLGDEVPARGVTGGEVELEDDSDDVLANL